MDSVCREINPEYASWGSLKQQMFQKAMEAVLNPRVKQPASFLIPWQTRHHVAAETFQRSGAQLGAAEIARNEGIAKRYVERLSRLAFVNPAIVEAICQGQQSRRAQRRDAAQPHRSAARMAGATRRARYQVKCGFQLRRSDAVVLGHLDPID